MVQTRRQAIPDAIPVMGPLARWGQSSIYPNELRPDQELRRVLVHCANAGGSPCCCHVGQGTVALAQGQRPVELRLGGNGTRPNWPQSISNSRPRLHCSCSLPWHLSRCHGPIGSRPTHVTGAPAYAIRQSAVARAGRVQQQTLEALPDLPTMVESGYKDFEVDQCTAGGPAGTPLPSCQAQRPDQPVAGSPELKSGLNPKGPLPPPRPRRHSVPTSRWSWRAGSLSPGWPDSPTSHCPAPGCLMVDGLAEFAWASSRITSS